MTNETTASEGIMGKLTGFFHRHEQPEVAAPTEEAAPVQFVTPVIDEHTEILNVARTAWGEARGDNMTYVIDVIANRVSAARIFIEEQGKPHPEFGNGTFTDCVKRPYQFDCWLPTDPNLPKMLAVTISDPFFLQAMQTATLAVKGELQDSTKAATFYYAKGSKMPSWAEGLEPCLESKKQLFFNNVK